MPSGGKRKGAGRPTLASKLSPGAIKDIREKIKADWLIRKLNAHVNDPEGKMVPSAVTAAVALLRKVLPDLQAIEHSGEIATKSAEVMSDNELANIASTSSNNPAPPPINPSKLN